MEGLEAAAAASGADVAAQRAGISWQEWVGDVVLLASDTELEQGASAGGRPPRPAPDGGADAGNGGNGAAQTSHRRARRKRMNTVSTTRRRPGGDLEATDCC